MVTVELDDDPAPEEVNRAIERIERAGSLPRGIAGGRSLTSDEDEEILRIHFDNLRRALLEDRMFEAAEGFSPTESVVLRVIEAGPDRMRFDEIRDGINERRKRKEPEDVLAESTIHHYLKRLREKQLVAHEHNQYSYVGP